MYMRFERRLAEEITSLKFLKTFDDDKYTSLHHINKSLILIFLKTSFSLDFLVFHLAFAFFHKSSFYPKYIL